ncbi:hypothetical protein HXX76_013173 [Chlamydomonas incerta]|uniref:cyclic pyranopterin monophosphate synthase n=1 Tax=Chlamydomonas incerta TaxID=51695 RepID=A0A835VR74_CHLIN|nr:hypothetical protein HXX76_013173 [Chlamydomonas incerta]|eukprot:KAG2426192.1 hypothetical protein HXX76_013173 [Chlamydomonas incerta]
MFKQAAALVLGGLRMQMQGASARAGSRLWSTTTRDIADANKELDDFFGVSTASRAASTASSSLPASSPSSDEGASPSPSYPAHPDSQAGPAFASGGYGSHSTVTEHAHVGASSVSGEPEESGTVAAAERRLTHIDASGAAAMVDVSQKPVTTREAQASCVVHLGAAYEAVAANSLKKGDVLKVAQLAGIMGAKATATLIPLCHNIPISKVDVQLRLEPPSRSVTVRALAVTDGKTGVEMEALTAASVAALTVYDMCKAAAKDMVVGGLQLDYKAGGRSGTYLRAGLRRADLLPSARPPL